VNALPFPRPDDAVEQEPRPNANRSGSMRHLQAEFDLLRTRFPAGFESSLTLPCLRRIQEERGYVADEDIDWLAAYIPVARIQLEEVLSFYTQFRRAPVGRWHLQVCRNVSCSMRGAETLAQRIARALGIASGETTADGRFTLTTVECLGSCGTAPVLMVNDAYHERMTHEKLDALLKALP
jgi:NADH-quinone oxidoreductase subunit E